MIQMGDPSIALPQNGINDIAPMASAYAKASEFLSPKASELLKKEQKYSVGAFTPVPVFFTKGLGSTLIVCAP